MDHSLRNVDPDTFCACKRSGDIVMQGRRHWHDDLLELKLQGNAPGLNAGRVRCVQEISNDGWHLSVCGLKDKITPVVPPHRAAQHGPAVQIVLQGSSGSEISQS